MLIRTAANWGAPNTVVYGLAIVSRKVSPMEITHTPSKKAQKVEIWVAGINQRHPNATIANPERIPPLYPNFRANHPAGRAIRKYPR